MGEAKRRGTKEQRVSEAISKKESQALEQKQTLINNRHRRQSRSRGIKRLSFGLAIALSALGTSAIEVRQHED
ncbi:hypothetical protein [Acinetobacter ursingii]|uniref:hypothetical protein n=1 Tax=Acinetobacter ursingii TaxID=108980 RepID=UPI0021CD33FE|nr:hypothetical protein [Acinetobacter ursingii]MCU4481249.1 hypothetical protein [Acinetobacter ursingii]MCU4505578.1 hypothetical protein [Acinetobacter ursingii]MCU4571056.1 hypothetical protein [Acinetobacter ursingii]